MIQKNIKEVQKRMEEPKYAKEIDKLQEMQKQFHEQLKKMPDTEGKNTFENHLPLMHPGMESDKEIENLIDSLRGQLKRPLPWKMISVVAYRKNKYRYPWMKGK